MRRSGLYALAILGSLSAISVASAAPVSSSAAHKPDLADAVAGSYFGNVISDSKGSSQSDVTLTVTRSGPNQITVTSDYPRLPQIDVKLSRAMGKILQTTGDSVFLYDPTKSPPHLDVSFHNEVSWSGARK